MLELLFDTIFFWCRVCFAVFLGQQMLCFVGETPYWYRTVFVCFVLYHVCLVSCLFRYVWFAVFVGQRMSCFEGETLFCCKICLFVEALFGTVFVRRLFILASCCLRLCWFDSQCLFRCVCGSTDVMFWGRGRPYTAAELSAHLHLAPENNFGEKDNQKENNIGEKNRDKTILVKRTTGNIFLFHLFGLYQGGVNIAGNNLLYITTIVQSDWMLNSWSSYSIIPLLSLVTFYMSWHLLISNCQWVNNWGLRLRLKVVQVILQIIQVMQVIQVIHVIHVIQVIQVVQVIQRVQVIQVIQVVQVVQEVQVTKEIQVINTWFNASPSRLMLSHA